MVVRPSMTSLEAAEDALFGVGVDAGQGVVEDEDFGVADDGAGDGGALFLAAGEGESALADLVSKPLGNSRISVAMWAMVAASSTCSEDASGLPKAMFWRMVSEKRKVSCGTKPMLLRSVDEGEAADGLAVDQDGAGRRRRGGGG